MAYLLEDEIEENFKENPHLYKMSMSNLAKFFYIQGQLSYSHLRQISDAKAAQYRRALKMVDPIALEKVEKELDEKV